MYCCFWEEEKKTKPEINKNNNNKNHTKQKKTQTKEKSPVISRHIYLNVDNKRKLTSNIPYKLLLTAPCWSSAHHRSCLVPLLTSTSLPCLGEHKLPEQKYNILCTSRPMLKNCVVGDPRTSTTSPQPQLFLSKLLHSLLCGRGGDGCVAITWWRAMHCPLFVAEEMTLCPIWLIFLSSW